MFLKQDDREVLFFMLIKGSGYLDCCFEKDFEVEVVNIIGGVGL